MFYCRRCAEVRNWPPSMVISRGICEICDELHDCFDTPSRLLPRPVNNFPERPVDDDDA